MGEEIIIKTKTEIASNYHHLQELMKQQMENALNWFAQQTDLLSIHSVELLRWGFNEMKMMVERKQSENEDQ